MRSNRPYVKLDPAVIEQARQMDLLSYLQRYEPSNLTLKILDKNKQPDIRFPEVPKVKTDIPVLKNEIVAIVLMYGECKPYIIGRCF